MEDINYMDRIHALYHRLPRDPQKPCTIDELKETIRDLYNTGINISSLKRAIQRDLDQLESFLSVGTVLYLDGKGNQPAQYRLSKNALIEKMNSELALILVMANDYIRQCVPDKIYEKVEGFFESATQLLEEDTKLSDWQSRIRFVPDGYGQLNKTAQNELIIQKIYEALLDNNAWLDVLYRKEKSSEQTLDTTANTSFKEVTHSPKKENIRVDSIILFVMIVALVAALILLKILLGKRKK